MSAAGILAAILTRREECLGREADLAEKLAGIAVCLLDADLLGHTEIVHGNEHLNLALDLNYHKDSERDRDGLLGTAVLEAAAETSCDTARDTAVAVTFAGSCEL